MQPRDFTVGTWLLKADFNLCDEQSWGSICFLGFFPNTPAVSSGTEGILLLWLHLVALGDTILRCRKRSDLLTVQARVGASCAFSS